MSLASAASASGCGHHTETLLGFAPILNNVNQDRFPGWAASIRRSLWPETPEEHLICTVSATQCGSFNIVFPLQFADGIKWAVKIPGTGHHDTHDAAAAQALRSEAVTLRLIKRMTTIPVPEVFAYDDSSHNQLACPFILMEFMSGIPLTHSWYDPDIPPATLMQRRAQTLNDLAASMVQLNQFSSAYAGQLQFDEHEKPVSIGPMRKYKVKGFNDINQTRVFVEVGPFTDVKSSFITILNQQKLPPAAFHLGMDRLLRLFIDWSCDVDDPSRAFVLTHPDLGAQNVLVSEDGRLCGLIDWDGVAFVPESRGNLRYPNWLTRDWFPLEYRFRPECHDCGDDSPTDLAFYRAMYVRYIQVHLAKDIAAVDNGMSVGKEHKDFSNKIDHDECYQHRGHGEILGCDDSGYMTEDKNTNGSKGKGLEEEEKKDKGKKRANTVGEAAISNEIYALENGYHSCYRHRLHPGVDSAYFTALTRTSGLIACLANAVDSRDYVMTSLIFIFTQIFRLVSNTALSPPSSELGNGHSSAPSTTSPQVNGVEVNVLASSDTQKEARDIKINSESAGAKYNDAGLETINSERRDRAKPVILLTSSTAAAASNQVNSVGLNVSATSDVGEEAHGIKNIIHDAEPERNDTKCEILVESTLSPPSSKQVINLCVASAPSDQVNSLSASSNEDTQDHSIKTKTEDANGIDDEYDIINGRFWSIVDALGDGVVEETELLWLRDGFLKLRIALAGGDDVIGTMLSKFR